MVKGISRRVVVVRSPSMKYFDEAIFIAKEDITIKEGVSAKELLHEAQSVADGYIKNQVYKRRFISKLTAPGLVAVGAGIGAVLFSLINFLL